MQMAHLISASRKTTAEHALNEMKKLIEQHEVMIDIKKTLKEMGKDEASQDEINMLRVMFMRKKRNAERRGGEDEPVAKKKKSSGNRK